MTILKTDPKTRRKLIYLYLLFFVLGLIAIQWGLPALMAILKQKSSHEILQIVSIIISVCFLSVLPFTIYFYRYGHRILVFAQFPPPGEKVIRDTKIITGDAARHRGRIIMVISLILALVVLYGGTYVPYKLYKSFENHTINQK